MYTYPLMQIPAEWELHSERLVDLQPDQEQFPHLDQLEQPNKDEPLSTCNVIFTLDWQFW